MDSIIILLLIGVAGGLIAGLLGIGGGIITVPALYYLLIARHIPQAQSMQIAVATSLAVICVTTLFAACIHFKKGAKFNYEILGYLVPGLIVGCILGAKTASLIPSDVLRIFFGFVIIGIGLSFSIRKLPTYTFPFKPGPLISLFAILIGAFSSLLGIGGGVFTIPLMLAYKVPAKDTIASCSASTMTTSLIGTITYLFIADRTSHSGFSFGYIEPVTFLWIVVGSFCSTPIGVKLALILPEHKIKKIFGCMMIFVGLFLIVGTKR